MFYHQVNNIKLSLFASHKKDQLCTVFWCFRVQWVHFQKPRLMSFKAIKNLQFKILLHHTTFTIRYQSHNSICNYSDLCNHSFLNRASYFAMATKCDIKVLQGCEGNMYLPANVSYLSSFVIFVEQANIIIFAPLSDSKSNKSSWKGFFADDRLSAKISANSSTT